MPSSENDISLVVPSFRRCVALRENLPYLLAIEDMLEVIVVLDRGVDEDTEAVVADEFGEASYQVVGPAEVDIAHGLISLVSPMGAALMGRSVGDTVTFSTPGGERSARVVRVD